MSWPTPASLLRHVPPALRLDAIVSRDDAQLTCRGDGPRWTWPEMLEGCAQTAGLFAGMRSDALDERAVIAEYRDVVIHAPSHIGPVGFTARFDRHVLGFQRYAVEARSLTGRHLMLVGLVTLAAVPE